MTDPPVTDPPATSPPATDPPATDPKATSPTGPANDQDRPELLTGGIPRRLVDVGRRTDSYGFVFLTLVALIWGVGPVLGSHDGTEVALTVVGTAVVALALHTSRVPIRWLWAAVGVAAVSTVLVVTGEQADLVWMRCAGHLIDAFLLLATAAVIMRRILTHRVVTSRTIFGAVSTYLLLGVAFSQVFIALEVVSSGSFAADSAITADTLVYLSLVTLATLGYGDVTPVSQLARSVATFEAIMGQIFLVTVVARLVGLFGQERNRRDADDRV